MKTNIKEVINQTEILFRSVPVVEVIPGIGIINHPMTNNAITPDPDDAHKFINITDHNNFEKVLKFKIQIMQERNDLSFICWQVEKQYRLTWWKLCNNFMSIEDKSDLLAQIWTSSENPNDDANCSIDYCIKAFKGCSKPWLMSEDEFEVYDSIGDTIDLYRGISKGRNYYGLSYTDDYSIAKWFANRFGEEKYDCVIKLTVKKEDVLCYLNNRGEKEFVVNINPYKSIIKSYIS